MDPTKTPSQRDYDHAVTLVEATIQKLGLAPAALRVLADTYDDRLAKDFGATRT